MCVRLFIEVVVVVHGFWKLWSMPRLLKYAALIDAVCDTIVNVSSLSNFDPARAWRGSRR
jgi:hypothetical protein